VRLLRKLWQLSWADRFLLVEAWIQLGAARFTLLTTPFRRIAPRLGRQQRPPPAPTQGGSTFLPTAARVAWAVETMSRHTPWESACLAQAIAGKYMLRRRGVASALYLGTRKDEHSQLLAHAWLRVGARIVLGGSGHDTFTALAAFDELPARSLDA
jgi:hypothetical protein